MGALVEKATDTLVNITRALADELRLAEQIETLLGESLLEEVMSKGSIYLGYIQGIQYTIYQADREDRDFLHRVRRALRIPTMKRRLHDYQGTFSWEGTSTVLFDGQPLAVSITAGNNGCQIKAIEETITRMRYESDCKPEDAILKEEAEGGESVLALADS